jgi:hypothetical protein
MGDSSQSKERGWGVGTLQRGEGPQGRWLISLNKIRSLLVNVYHKVYWLWSFRCVLFHFYGPDIHGLERLSGLFKITEVLTNRERIRIQIFGFSFGKPLSLISNGRKLPLYTWDWPLLHAGMQGFPKQNLTLVWRSLPQGKVCLSFYEAWPHSLAVGWPASLTPHTTHLGVLSEAVL